MEFSFIDSAGVLLTPSKKGENVWVMEIVLMKTAMKLNVAVMNAII